MKLQLHFRKVSETCFTVLRTDGTAIRTFTISQSLDVKNNGTNILFTDKQGRQLQELPITNFRNITIDDLPPFSTPKECVTALSAIVNFKHGGGTPVTTLSSDSVTNESSVEGDNVTEALDWLKENAATGKDGITPHIGSNGNWYIGETDTGVKAEGTNGNDGATPYISGRNWWVNGVDTGVQAQGQNGEPGMQGVPGKDGVPGQNGQDGDTPFIGVNGNWWIGKIDTGVAAQGEKGETGATGATGATGIQGTHGNNGTDGEDGKSAYESALLGGMPETTSEEDFYAILAETPEKLNRVTSTTPLDQAYVKKADGSQIMIDIQPDAITASTMVKRTTEGTIFCATPTHINNAANKSYVDGQITLVNNRINGAENDISEINTRLDEIEESGEWQPWDVMHMFPPFANSKYHVIGNRCFIQTEQTIYDGIPPILQNLPKIPKPNCYLNVSCQLHNQNGVAGAFYAITESYSGNMSIIVKQFGTPIAFGDRIIITGSYEIED